jgi:hypothetical protein
MFFSCCFLRLVDWPCWASRGTIGSNAQINFEVTPQTLAQSQAAA